MKTIWHWGNVVKASFCIIAVAIIWTVVTDFFGFPYEVRKIGGICVGGVSGIFCLMKWCLWHFE